MRGAETSLSGCRGTEDSSRGPGGQNAPVVDDRELIATLREATVPTSHTHAEQRERQVILNRIRPSEKTSIHLSESECRLSAVGIR